MSSLVAAPRFLSDDLNPIFAVRDKWVIDLSQLPLEQVAARLDWIFENSSFNYVHHPDLWHDGRWEG